MNFSTMIFPPPPTTPASVGLLLLRVFAGLSMASHGWGKIQDPFHWLDKAENPPPAIFQFLAAFAEFFGGLGLAVGLLSVIASFGIICTMLVAVQFHVSKGDPFGKWELAALYCCISVLVLLGGPGRLSIDALIRSWLEKRATRR
ncbi:MAG: DoxX family protein [Archangium sp.]|nr:DoxX family protein [Archangium sp.]MDP3156348.1 DoxX family protein [Archangium sp.]MDP3570392.1 DoxX family protein [Archangium sp.]